MNGLGPRKRAMGCCNNKKECDTAKAEFTDMALWLVKGLTDVVNTGRIPSFFKHPAADQLAVMIANLVDENKYLRAILGVLRPDVIVTNERFQISFGPGKNYLLTIPVTTESERIELIESLQVAIKKLQELAPVAPIVPDKGQLPLFVDVA